MYGTDQFIGEIDYWDKGIGTRLMKLMIDHLMYKKHSEKIVLDPQAWNQRAIACYEKCGFKKVKYLPKHEYHEGELRDCWLMEYSR
ncbi:GNAT family N-acetyltransferase [Priestia megaterium]